MKKAEYKNFKTPDEVRTFEKGKLELLNIGGGVVGLLTLYPGWQWSKHVKPISNTQWCEAPHFQYMISGKLRIKMSDGTEFEVSAGDVVNLPENHDAWVVGEENVVSVDWQGAINYAKE